MGPQQSQASFRKTILISALQLRETRITAATYCACCQMLQDELTIFYHLTVSKWPGLPTHKLIECMLTHLLHKLLHWRVYSLVYFWVHWHYGSAILNYCEFMMSTCIQLKVCILWDLHRAVYVCVCMTVLKVSWLETEHKLSHSIDKLFRWLFPYDASTG